jgi:hypothetical protein
MGTPCLGHAVLLLFCSLAQAQAPEHGEVYWADQFPGKDMGEKINRAITAANGGVIKIPAGQFTYSTPIKISKNLALEGSGKTTLISTSPTNNQIEVLPGANHATIAHLMLYTGPAIKPTAGAGIKVNASFVRISDVTIWNQYDGIRALAIQNVYVDHCDIRAINDDLRTEGTVGLVVSNSKLYSGGPSTGLHLTSAAGIWLTDVEMYNGLHGIVFDPAADTNVVQVFAKGVVVDTTIQDGILIAGVGVVGHVDFTDSWTAGSVDGNGISFTNPNANGFSWTGGFIRGNHLNGAYIRTGTNIQILAAQISANGQRNITHDNSYGIRIAPGVRNFRISQCFLGPTGSDNRTQTYGVFIDPGSTDFFQIIDNMDTGDTKGLMADGSTGKHKVVRGNLPE